MSGRPNAFSDRQCERIARLYTEQKLSVETIAERMDSNAMSVWRTLKRRGVEIRNNPRQSMIDADTLHQLYWTQQKSTVQIAAQYGLKKETVRGWLKKFNIKTRNKTEAALLSPSDWTPERVALLKELWPTGMPITEMHKRLGISYGLKAVSRKAQAIGMEPRANPVKPVAKPRPAAVAVAAHKARPCGIRSIIDFSPNLRLQTMWVECLQAVRKQRGSQWTELFGVTR